MLLAITSAAYVGAAALYHGHPKRCGVTALASMTGRLRWFGFGVLLLITVVAVLHWGAERGIPLALGAISLASPASLLLATRSPQWHLRSVPLAVLGILGGLAL